MTAIASIVLRIWASKYGKGAIAALIVGALAWGYVASERRDAAEAERMRIEQEAQQRALDTLRRIDNATRLGGSADDIRRRLRDLLPD